MGGPGWLLYPNPLLFSISAGLSALAGARQLLQEGPWRFAVGKGLRWHLTQDPRGPGVGSYGILIGVSSVNLLMVLKESLWEIL